jgi:glycosyltransferase involved in cell wall biosynthesis
MTEEIRGKVLFTATVYTHLAAFHAPFMKLLQSWGHEVHAAASPAEGRKDEIEALGVTCHDVPFARSVTSTRNFRAYRTIRRLLARQRYDLIHVHTPVAAWLTRFAARRAGQGPVLYTAHGFHFFRGAPWAHWLLFYPLERIAARWTDGLIVMNGEDLDRARRIGFVQGENLFLVHGVGVDLAAYAPAEGLREAVRAELGLARGDLVVTCVAEFTPTKDHAQLLAAWPEVVRRIHQARLLLVGDGQLRVGIERTARERAIPNVGFLGFRRDVPALLAGTDVFVLPSRREGLPRSVLEALAAGVPVVATDVRGNRDLVEDGRNGFLVKVGDATGLAQALLTLLQDESLRTRMGVEGRARARDYALDRVIREMAAIYGRFLGRV